MAGTPRSNRCLLATLVILASLAAPVDARDGESRLWVTVTVPPFARLVSEVAGPEVVVEHLIAIGDVPETLQPTRA